MRIAVFTSGRQDWGILAPVCERLRLSRRLELRVIAGGLHLRGQAPSAEIDGLPISKWLPTYVDCDRPALVAHVAGLTISLLTGAMKHQGAEALVLAGDRTETLAAAVACTCMRIPIIHLHGGEESAGAIDNSCRHAISKLAHLHCVAHPQFAERLRSMGEPADRVHVSGAPSLDRLFSGPRHTPAELATRLRLPWLGRPFILFTHHPATLGIKAPAVEIAEVIAGVRKALEGLSGALVLATRANNDTGGEIINRALDAWARHDSRCRVIEALGPGGYFAAMSCADAMVGNSSSGLLDEPSFDLPVVNVGGRQEGRLRIGRLKDVPAECDAVAAAVRETLATVEETPRKPRATAFGDGKAAERIVEALEAFAWVPDWIRLRKDRALPLEKEALT